MIIIVTITIIIIVVIIIIIIIIIIVIIIIPRCGWACATVFFSATDSATHTLLSR